MIPNHKSYSYLPILPPLDELEDPFWTPYNQDDTDIALSITEADLVPGELYELWSIHRWQDPHVFLTTANRPIYQATPRSSVGSSILDPNSGEDDLNLGGIISIPSGTICLYIQTTKNPSSKKGDGLFGLLEVLCSEGLVYTTIDQLRICDKEKDRSASPLIVEPAV